MIRYSVPLIAIIGIILLEFEALKHGIDGQTLSLAIGSIAGVGGYHVKKALGKKKKGETE
jgi:CDP-diglyceride synthetase